MQAQPFPPPSWNFKDLAAFDVEESLYAKEKQLAVEILLRFERNVATHSIARTGGTSILRPQWSAEAILGDKFKGNLYPTHPPPPLHLPLGNPVPF